MTSPIDDRKYHSHGLGVGPADSTGCGLFPSSGSCSGPRYAVFTRKASPSHINFGLFVNGSLAGELCLRLAEFQDFKRRLGID